VKSAAVAEWQALGDAVSVGAVHDDGLAEAAEALGVFGLGQVAAAGAGALDLTGGGDFEPLGDGLVRFNAFGTTHKSINSQKESRTIPAEEFPSKPEFELIWVGQRVSCSGVKVASAGNLFAAAHKTRFHPRVSKLEKFLIYWLPPLAWMGLIFSASADTHSYQHSSGLFLPLLHWIFPGMSIEHIEMIHHGFRKCGHLTEFAILALLFWRAIHHTRRPLVAPQRSEGGWRWEEAGLALSFVFLYAASDELHQVFVPTRTALVSDVFIDSAGGAIGLMALWGLGKIFKYWQVRT
jgi:VanZ family protein